MSNPSLTVYFRGFPEDIPNEELETVFAKYGSIVKIFVHKSRSYGMVEYSDLSSCVSAINSLNGELPLNLYLNMAKTQPSDKQQNTSMTEKFSGNKFNNHNVDHNQVTYKEEYVYYDENNDYINVLQDPTTNEIYVPIRYAPNIRRILKKIPVPIDNGVLRNGNVSDDDCGSVYTSISQHSNRKVNFNNSIPHDIRIERSFTEEDDALPTTSRKGPNSKRLPYGNRQSNDGFNKKDETKTGFGSRFSNDNQPDGFNKRDEAKTGGNRFSNDNRSNNGFNFNKNDGGFNKNDETKQFRRPKPGASQSSGSGDESNKPRFNKKYPSASGDNLTQKFPKKEFNKSKTSEKGEADWGAHSAITEEPTPQNSSSIIAKKSPFSNLKPKTTNKVLYKSVELPKNKYTQVQIEHTVSDTVGWAQIVDNETEFGDFMVLVIEKALKSPKPTSPEIGKICLAKYEDFWFRAVVLTIFPKTTVRFIDYGNESVVEGDILEISPEDRDVPAYAVCINLADGAPCKIKNSLNIKVKPVKVDNDVVVVHVENGLYDREVPSTSASTSSSSTHSLAACQESMMSKLNANMTGMFEATIKLSSTKIVAFFLPTDLAEDASLLEDIYKTVKNMNASSFRPKVGDLVSAENDGWHRAVVLKIENGFKVAFIDYGTIKTVPEVKPLPDEFKSIPQFSCVATASEKDLTKVHQNTDELSFKITKIVNKTIHCNLSTAEETDFCAVTFVLWNPEEESSASSGRLSKMSSTSASSVETVRQVKPPTQNKLEPPELKLKSGDDVKVVDESKGFLFVRTKEASEILKRVDKYISEYAPKAPKILEKPIVGQYVAAQFENVWYRAKVINLKQNSADILYIDYGNEEIKPFFSLKQLDEKICEEPCTLIKIKLKGFVDKPFTPKCLEFFARLAETNQILKATFQGSEDNGVDLLMKDGKNVTDELIKLDCPPKAKPFQTRKELYMKVKVPGPDDPKIMSINLEAIPLGQGEVRYLCDVDLKTNAICVCVNKPDMLHKVHVELLNQMTKYVNNIAPKQPYVPEREEIVLVENKEKWYRAICLELEADGSIVVFFMDYGFNLTVSADKIRQMPREFVEEFNALGNFAAIHGLPATLNDNITDRLGSLLLNNETYKVDVLENTDDNYIIDFPEILELLKSENLV